MTKTSFKLIALSERNYLALKELGHAGDSFNDVITVILRKQMFYHDLEGEEK